MNDKNKSTLVPKLRFSEFRGTEGWKSVPLSEIVLSLDAGVSVNSGDRPAAGNEIGILKTSSVTNGIFESQENKVVFDGIEKKRVKEPVQAGTIIISRMNTPALVGANAYVESSLENIYLPDRLWAAKPKPGTSMRFVASILGSDKARAALSKLAKGSSGSMKNLTKTDVFAFFIESPSPAEQQKIADCLSSLDELIAAQSRKVDALKTHKKGLMQQLFPREGETQPRLRFPEFRDAGEWSCEAISSCLEKVIDYRGKAPPKSEFGVPLITARNVRFGWLDMTIDEYIEADEYEGWMTKGIPKAEDILFTTEAPLGNVALFPNAGKFALGQRIITLRANQSKCRSGFLFQSLLGPQMQHEVDFHSTGSTAKGIKSSVFLTIDFCYPGLEEQQRIADCLTYLDTLITAATQEFESLKIHKKGLMQQLFPDLDKKSV